MEWISVNKSLPELVNVREELKLEGTVFTPKVLYSQLLLICFKTEDGYKAVSNGRYELQEGGVPSFYCDDSSYVFFSDSVTHWMYIPEIPNDH